MFRQRNGVQGCELILGESIRINGKEGYAPGVHCISEGKEHKKYEFGNKGSILYTQNTGVIVGASAFQSQYDGHRYRKF